MERLNVACQCRRFGIGSGLAQAETVISDHRRKLRQCIEYRIPRLKGTPEASLKHYDRLSGKTPFQTAGADAYVSPINLDDASGSGGLCACSRHKQRESDTEHSEARSPAAAPCVAHHGRESTRERWTRTSSSSVLGWNGR